MVLQIIEHGAQNEGVRPILEMKFSGEGVIIVGHARMNRISVTHPVTNMEKTISVSRKVGTKYSSTLVVPDPKKENLGEKSWGK